jgi:NadR type nicotinamide-nucleotide adenylyltransferase
LGITHFYSSEPYGEHVSLALSAINRQVDPGRFRVPISATRIRQNPYAARQFIADEVYPDLISNFVFVGAPSTGKTTLVKHLAERFSATWMPEYGAEYWLKNQQNHRLNLRQLVEIAHGHLEREQEKLLQARNILFSDTNVLTTNIFSHYYHGKADPELEMLTQKHARRYDHYFLCDTDIPFADTWDRSGPASREVMQAMIIEDLVKRKIEFTRVHGSVEERAGQVVKIMQSGLFNKLF